MKYSLIHFMSALTLVLLMNSCTSDGTLPVPGSQQQTEQLYYVVADSLNLRECPSTECRIVNVLKRGDHGLAIDQQTPWVQIQLLEKRYTGWVAGRYLSPDFVEKKQSTPMPEISPKGIPKMPEESLAKPVSYPPTLKEELAIPETNTYGAPPEISETLAAPPAAETVTPPAALEEEFAQ